MQRAFSLVELSIVLVILGLLVGGILAGQSLIRASELRSVATEIHRYTTAAHAFRDKYFALPGDFIDATRVWGRQSTTGNCLTNSAAAVNTSGTCDGDGDGTIRSGATASNTYEIYQYWRQLALAGLIEGNYSGYATAVHGLEAVPGTNVPGSRLSGAGTSVRYQDATYLGDSRNYQMDYGNHYIIGAPTTGVSSALTSNGVMKAEEVWNIDTKIDDGRPAYGRLTVVGWTLCTTSNSKTSFNSQYQLDEPSVSCNLRYKW